MHFCNPKKQSFEGGVCLRKGEREEKKKLTVFSSQYTEKMFRLIYNLSSVMFCKIGKSLVLSLNAMLVLKFK